MRLREKVCLFVSLTLILFVAGCSSENPAEIKWDLSDKEVVGAPPGKSDQIDIDVYIDATTSMEGFAINNSSVYSQFIDQVEASALSAWKNTDPRYFKFGEIIKPVSRTEFLSAKNDPSFYHEKGIFKRTYIDSVVRRTDSKRLSVLITDLFQDEGDVNIMVERFKEKCFANGVKVGVVGVKSGFKGQVFDVPGFPSGYRLESAERPFYAIVFGNQYNMELLFDAMKAKQFVREDNILIFSNYAIKSFDASLAKTRESTFINNKKARTPVKNSFEFQMKEAGTSGRFNLSIDLNRNSRCADFSEKNLEVVAFKKVSNDPKIFSKDSVPTDEISIENIKRTGNKLTATLVLNNADKKGNYSYQVYLKVNPLTGLQSPAWVTAFSTDNPVPNTASASKTYNFQKLCSTLLVAQSSISPTYVAKIYINIFKR